MDLWEFVQKHIKTKVDFDGAYGAQCFTGGHCVLMADWTYKPIEDVRVGDKVVGYDNGINTVTKLFTREADVVHIRTDLTDFYVTKEHPFFFKNGKFLPATELVHERPALFDRESFVESGLTDDELRFLGFWLGDGNVAKHHDGRTDEIRITYGEKKAGFVHSLNIISTEHRHHLSEKAFVAGIKKQRHKLLAKVILEQCARAEKHLPLIFTNREYALIIDGFIHADGTPHHNSYAVTNTSIPLLREVQAACILLGYKTKSVRESRRPMAEIIINGKPVKSVRPLFRLTIARTNKKSPNEYAEILETKKETVYNIETDGTHTYICDNYKVHNCVDLFRQYCKDVLEIPHTGAVEGAKDLVEKYRYLSREQEHFALVEDKWSARPGDAAVWGQTGSNPFGHVAIVLEAKPNHLLVFEQDGYRQGEGAKIARENYANIIGYLRPRSLI